MTGFGQFRNQVGFHDVYLAINPDERPVTSLQYLCTKHIDRNTYFVKTLHNIFYFESETVSFESFRYLNSCVPSSLKGTTWPLT